MLIIIKLNIIVVLVGAVELLISFKKIVESLIKYE